MLISELPQELKELALEYQRNEKDIEFFTKDSDDLNLAFDWEESKEGWVFWIELHNREV